MPHSEKIQEEAIRERAAPAGAAADGLSTVVASRRRRWWMGGLASALVLAGGAAIGLRSFTATASAPPQQPPPTPVSVATVHKTDVATFSEFSGRLEAIERVDIRPRVAGTVKAVSFREGALVRKGDVLLLIDPEPYAAEVERAEAQVAAARARVSFTRSELERAFRLLEERAIAQREHDERANALREADANLRAALASLQTAKLNLGYTEVRAPVAGRVGRLEITAGNLVAAGPGAPVLTTLVSVSPIYASFDADEQVVNRALREVRGLSDRRGDSRERIDRIPVQMGTADTLETPFSGRLQLVDNQVDARSGTVRVRAVFDNTDGSLMPGQYARLRMGAVNKESVLLINERAVGTDQNKKFVMVVGDDNQASYREVTLGAQVDGLRIVTSGLQPQERVIVNGLQRVRPGSRVEPQTVSMEPKAQVGGRRDGSPPS